MSVTPELAERALYSADEYPAPGLFLAETIQPHHFGAFARLRRFVLVLGDRRGGGNGQSGRRGDGGELGPRRVSGCVGIGLFELPSPLPPRISETLHHRHP